MALCCCAENETSYHVIDLAQPTLDEGRADATMPKTGKFEPEVNTAPPAPPVKEEPPVPTVAIKPEPEISSPEKDDTGKKSFVAKFQKQSVEMLGWRLDCVGLKCIYIFSITESTSTPVAVYNASVSDDLKIEQGDYICAVNGVSGVTGMVEAIDKNNTLEVTIRRPHVFKATVKKTEALGLELKYWPSASSLLIGEIRQGAITKQGVDIIPEDRILSINGKNGSVDELLAAIRTMDTLEFRVSRCPA